LKTVKEELYHYCVRYVQDRRRRIQDRVNSILESLGAETKSTAGDKHETGRAMLQLEREKAGVQLAEVQKLQEILVKIDLSTTSEVARLGSIVTTSHANYFLSVSVGKIIINNIDYFAIATNTPIGKHLLGKRIGDQIRFNGNILTIKSIL